VVTPVRAPPTLHEAKPVDIGIRSGVVSTPVMFILKILQHAARQVDEADRERVIRAGDADRPAGYDIRGRVDRSLLPA
jgi:hypothetical protein